VTRLAILFLTALALGASTGAVMADSCGDKGVALQVLGSGGPELRRPRASTSYVVWHDGRSIALIDSGGGSALRFAESGARFSHLRVVLFTHLHADHNADFPALVKSSFFEGRDADLPVLGPAGNRFLPAMDRYLSLAFGEQGAYPYLSDVVDGSGSWTLVAGVVDPREDGTWKHSALGDGLSVSAVRVEHGVLPALGWRVDVAGRSIVVSGDMNGRLGHLGRLAQGADLFVAHHAIPEDSTDRVARRLHMPPSMIGRIAEAAKVRRVVLSHIMQRTEDARSQSLAAIAEYYAGPVDFAADLACYPLP